MPHRQEEEEEEEEGRGGVVAERGGKADTWIHLLSSAWETLGSFLFDVCDVSDRKKKGGKERDKGEEGESWGGWDSDESVPPTHISCCLPVPLRRPSLITLMQRNAGHHGDL